MLCSLKVVTRRIRGWRTSRLIFAHTRGKNPTSVNTRDAARLSATHRTALNTRTALTPARSVFRTMAHVQQISTRHLLRWFLECLSWALLLADHVCHFYFVLQCFDGRSSPTCNKKAQLTPGLHATAPSFQDGGSSKMAVTRKHGVNQCNTCV